MLLSLVILFFFWPGYAASQVGKKEKSQEQYTFKREIRLAPGEFYAVTYDKQRKEFTETEPDRGYGVLPKPALREILRAPAWLREKFADKLVDLYYDYLDFSNDAAPVFYDVDQDGLDDLVVGNGAGQLRCFLAPYYKENGRILEHVKVPAGAVPFFVEPSNGAPGMLVVADSSGVHHVWKGERFGTYCGILETPRHDFPGPEATYQCPFGTIRVLGKQDGSIVADVQSSSSLSDQLRANLNRIKVSGRARPVFKDISGDTLPDLLIGASDGTIRVFLNHGTASVPWFVTFRAETDRRFDSDVGYLSSPRIGDIDGDGSSDIVCGSNNGVLTLLKAPDYSIQTNSCLLEINDLIDGVVVPAVGDFNSDGRSDIAVGLEDGSIRVFLRQRERWHQSPQFSRDLRVPQFAVPYSIDFNDDGLCDLLVGSGADEEGKHRIYLFKNTGKQFVRDDILSRLDVGEYPSPAGYDINQDGKMDLIVGNHAGELKVFLAPQWDEEEGGLGLEGHKSYTSPAFGDIDGDGLAELLLGSIDGKLCYLEKQGNIWTERYSWQFHMSLGLQKLEDYSRFTHPESMIMRGMIDKDSVNAYVEVLKACEDRYLDEAIFSIAEIQTEILRTMARLKNADIVVENARGIYSFAAQVAYADIVEKDGYSTIKYVNWDAATKEMPPEIYYMWVVHPVIDCEIPARVNASYWRKTHDELGITHEQWTRKELSIDMYDHGQNTHFWRSFMMKDVRYGRSLLDVVKPARNIKEATYLVANWIAFASYRPGGWNEYGLKSNDRQPLVIYEKNYGSCGEQSTMCCAFSRTALIPNAPVGCRGEDHSWNEWWMDGNWQKWDVCIPPMSIGCPWNEQRGHKKRLLCITRRWPTGFTDNSSTRPANPPGCNYNPENAPGYTSVGRIRFRVVDEAMKPVEGALIMVRSKWKNYYRVALMEYTNPLGYVDIELGAPETGSCVVDVITPLGLTGTENLVVRENEQFEYTYVLPGLFNARAPVETAKEASHAGPHKVSLSISVIAEEQRPQNIIRYSRDADTAREFQERTGYRGTRWFSKPNEHVCGVYLARLSACEYEEFLRSRHLPPARRITSASFDFPFDRESGEVFLFFNAHRYTYTRFQAAFTAFVNPEPPRLRLIKAPSSGVTGERIEFTGEAFDNLHISVLKASFDGGASFIDITDSYDRTTGRFEYLWDTGAGGPKPTGKYQIVFCVQDDSGNQSLSEMIAFSLDGTRSFHEQVIYQDDPNSPLPVSSWILGPFSIVGNERFIGVRGKGHEQDLDMDLFLYFDKNGNRKLDGKDEQIASSKSPTAIEAVLHENPQPGIYWVYCHGWRVEKREEADAWKELEGLAPGKMLTLCAKKIEHKTAWSFLDVSLSFDWQSAFIVDVGPVGEVTPEQAVISGSILPGFDLDPRSLTVMIGSCEVADHQIEEISARGFKIRPGNLEIGREYKVEVQARSSSGILDKATWTLRIVAPFTASVEHEINDDCSEISVKVKFRDMADVQMASAHVNEGKPVPLQLSEDGTSASCSIPIADIASGDHKLHVQYQFAGKEMEKKEFGFSFKRHDKNLLQMKPRGKVFDHRSPIMVYYTPQIKEDVESVRLLVDGTDVTKKALAYTDGVMYFPLKIFAKGEHCFRCEVTLSDGRVIAQEQKFTVMSMDD